MTSRVLYILSAGLKQLQLNTHLLLVAVLLIVLPGLFVWFAQDFFSASYQNIITSEKQNVSQVQDSIEFTFLNARAESLSETFLIPLVQSDTRLTKVRILRDTRDGLVIEHSSELDEIGLQEGGGQLYATSATTPGESLIFDFTIDEARTWQVFRQLRGEQGTFYIFTEHTYAEIDAVIAARQQQVYLVLPFIFLFLIGLAYWLLKQTQWQKQSYMYQKRLEEQMLFSNTIAHELRAPLTAIRGYVSFLAESKSLTADEHGFVKNINASSERLLALINDFLEVARIQSGKLKIEFAKQDVRKTLEAVKTEFTQIAQSKNLDFQLILPPEPVVAETDGKRLQQVVTNLVSNALKYTDSGSVTVSLEQTKLRTLISISDTGHGISAEDQQKLFGAFTRVGNADSGTATGTGLGMWITKQLVEMLHGKITVESIEGVGTKVKLTFEV